MSISDQFFFMLFLSSITRPPCEPWVMVNSDLGAALFGFAWLASVRGADSTFGDTQGCYVYPSHQAAPHSKCCPSCLFPGLNVLMECGFRFFHHLGYLPLYINSILIFFPLRSLF